MSPSHINLATCGMLLGTGLSTIDTTVNKSWSRHIQLNGFAMSAWTHNLSDSAELSALGAAFENFPIYSVTYYFNQKHYCSSTLTTIVTGNGDNLSPGTATISANSIT